MLWSHYTRSSSDRIDDHSDMSATSREVEFARVEFKHPWGTFLSVLLANRRQGNTIFERVEMSFVKNPPLPTILWKASEVQAFKREYIVVDFVSQLYRELTHRRVLQGRADGIRHPG